MPNGTPVSGSTAPQPTVTATAIVGVPTRGINANTPIIFTVKSFFATVGTILGLFVGFYTLVIVPSMKKSEKHQKELYIEQKEYVTGQFNAFRGTLNKNTNAIGLNTAALSATNARFNDLNTSVTRLNNSGGGFGDNTSTGGDPSLAENPD